MDSNGNLTERQDLRQGLTETFSYDALDRLDLVTLNGTATLDVDCDLIGNITRKSDVSAGLWSYHPSKKHAVTATGSGGPTYGYDANGNVTNRSGATLNWTSFNLPSAINGSGGTSAQFWYGPDRQRFKQVAAYSSGSETTYYVGGVLEKRVRSGNAHYRHLIGAPGGLVALYTRRSSGSPSESTYYLTHDHLGSIDSVTGATGTVQVRLSYDAFGRRRKAAGWSGTLPSGDTSALTAISRRGYTGHEHLDNLALIHMNGRVQDPLIGRFLAADPFVPEPFDGQSWNRYSYVRNNPLSRVDPTGYWDECYRGCIDASLTFPSGRGNAPPVYGTGILSFTSGFLGGASEAGRSPEALASGPGAAHYDQQTGLVNQAAAEALWPASTVGGSPAVSAGEITLAALGIAALATPVPGDETLLLGAGGARALGVLGGALGVAAAAQTASDRVANYVSGIVERATGGPDQYQYALVALTPGPRPNVRGGVTHLNVGDVYKYGTSVNPDKRYSQAELTALDVVPVRQYYGTATSVLIQEKLRLLGYFSEHGTLPPGNRIWR